ncbi:hypothetical protein SCY21_22695, partial [Xanthomonas euvesicatoria]|uniref:hypothetical protein n=1 Tax=Xanthomonas euvesicatoria TaxID=456327 RepID=UPI00298E1CB7
LGLLEHGDDLAVGKAGLLHGTSSGKGTRKFHFWRLLIGGGITCRQLIFEQLQQAAGRRKKRSVTGVTGGFTDIEQCARGLVSQQCGGNKVQR